MMVANKAKRSDIQTATFGCHCGGGWAWQSCQQGPPCQSVHGAGTHGTPTGTCVLQLEHTQAQGVPGRLFGYVHTERSGGAKESLVPRQATTSTCVLAQLVTWPMRGCRYSGTPPKKRLSPRTERHPLAPCGLPGCNAWQGCSKKTFFHFVRNGAGVFCSIFANVFSLFPMGFPKSRSSLHDALA